MTKVKVGIIGYGFSGRTFHAPVIERVDGLELAKFVSSDPAKVHRDYPGVPVVSSAEEMMADPDIDMVVVATSNTTHHKYAKEALLAGKHVVVEKPFANRAAEADELVRLAKEANRVISVYHNRRYDNNFLTVRKCIEDGLLGRVHTYESRFDRFGPVGNDNWRNQDIDGSGTLYDLGSHLIDQALVLFGVPQTVFASLGIQRPKARVTDNFTLMLGYDQRRVLLHSSYVVARQSPNYIAHGTAGSFIKSGADPQEGALIRGGKPGDANWGEDPEELYGELTIVRENGHVSQRVPTIPGRYDHYYRDVYEAIAHGKPNPVTPEDGRNIIKLIELAIRSDREKRALPFE